MDKIREKVIADKVCDAYDYIDDRIDETPRPITVEAIKFAKKYGLPNDVNDFLAYNRHFGFKPSTLAEVL
jgi:hypothetical protein